MKKYSSHTIKIPVLDSLLKDMVSFDRERTLYIGACRQLIKVGKNSIYNIITTNTSIPAEYFDKFNKEVITLDMNPYINYIKSKTNSSISLRAGGLLIIKEAILHKNLKVLVSLKINTINQLLKLSIDPDSVIIKLETLKQDSNKIDYNNRDLRNLIIEEDSIFSNLFLSGTMIKRLIKLSSLGIIGEYITKEEFSKVLELQSSIQNLFTKNNSNKFLFTDSSTSSRNQFNFYIADLFLCCGNRQNIKLIGTKESFSPGITPKRIKICLNYIKYMDKFYDVTDKLEGIKLSLI